MPQRDAVAEPSRRRTAARPGEDRSTGRAGVDGVNPSPACDDSGSRRPPLVTVSTLAKLRARYKRFFCNAIRLKTM
jgi:hypothetical protein